MGSRLTGLDALRGIAALFVLGFHIGANFDTLPYFSRGYIAVDFFFMLSGYVLARTYEGQFEPAWFLMGRFRRLAPIMGIGALAGLFAFLSIGQFKPVDFLATLVFLPLFTNGVPFVLNRPAWSIFFELLANASHALLFANLSRGPLLLLAVVCLALLSTGPLELIGARADNFFMGVPRVVAPYVIGILIWRTFGDKPRWGFHWSAMALVGGMVALTVLPDIADIAFIAMVCPLIIIGGFTQSGRFGAFLGELSFPLYAVHYPIMQMVLWWGGSWIMAAAASILAATIVVQLGQITRPLATLRSQRAA